MSKQQKTSYIFLIGFMGCGKSSVAKALADKLHWKFIDTDDLIEKGEDATISEIFKTRGEEEFRKLETYYLKNINTEYSIIATGGGMPCFHDNMKWINDHGTSIYLKVNPQALFERLKLQKEHRPLVQQLSEEALMDFIKNKLKERSRYYEQAQVIVENNSFKDTIATIIDYWV